MRSRSQSGARWSTDATATTIWRRCCWRFRKFRRFRRQKEREKEEARRGRPGVAPALRSGEDGEGGTRIQFPAPAELEGEQGDGAMACNPRPRLLLLWVQKLQKRGEGRSGGGGWEERRRRLGFGAASGSCRGLGSRWRRGPRGAPCRAMAFGEGAVTRTTVGPAVQRERRRGGPCCCAPRARGRRRLGRPIRLAWLPPRARFPFFFFALFLF